MSLPTSRNTDYTPLSKVKAADLNDIEDCIVAGAHGATFIIAHPFACALEANVTRNVAGYVAFGAASAAYWTPQLRAGDRGTTFNARVYGNGVTQFAINAWKMSAGGVLTNIGGPLTIAPPNGAWGDASIDLTDTTLADTESFFISIESNGAALRLGNLKLGMHHPL